MGWRHDAGPLRPAPREGCPRAKHGVVVPEHFWITDLGIHERHGHTLMPQYLHDRMELGATLRQLRPDGVPKPMRRDRGPPVGIHQAHALADRTEGCCRLVM
jgi:hypothetical protein